MSKFDSVSDFLLASGFEIINDGFVKDRIRIEASDIPGKDIAFFQKMLEEKQKECDERRISVNFLTSLVSEQEEHQIIPMFSPTSHDSPNRFLQNSSSLYSFTPQVNKSPVFSPQAVCSI